MKSNILTIYGINQRLSQMGRYFCWPDMPTLWEFGYESVAVSLFIAKKKLTQIAAHCHTHRGVKVKPVCENKLCMRRKKKINRA